jgi:uncharacterized protein
MATTQQSLQDDAGPDALVGGPTRADGSTSPARVPLRQRKDIATFLLLTFGLSSLAWAPVISSGSLKAGGGLYVAPLMWCPGLAAIATRLLFQRNLRGFGWRPGKPRYLLLGYVLPLGLTALVYSGVWLTGLGRFSPADLAGALSSSYGVALNSGVTLVPIAFAVTATVFVVLGALTALGEELGWRGFLVPELARSTSFHRVALISGGIWAAWHAPVIVFADYNAGTPAWYSVACFSATVVSVGVVSAWLRLRSGSVWPVVLLHASHNAFMQTFFDPATASTELTPFVTTEFGLGLALVWFGVAAYLWRRPPTRRAPIDASDG